MIPQEIIERVRAATNIVDVISQYVALKPAGRGYKGICPFHQEKTPSFHVNAERQFFHCFGCGAGGNVYHFLMRAEGLSFGEAVRALAGRAHISLAAAESAAASEQDRLRRQLLEVNAWAAAFFVQVLQNPKLSSAARAYLSKRGVPEDLAGKFGLGYAPPGWDHLLQAAQAAHYSEALLEQAGLVVRKRPGPGWYDRFRDRIMFPIRDLQGRTVGFGGRVLGSGEPKYLNSPETEVFRKGEQLFGLDQAKEAARRAGRLVLVEGYLDVMACHAAGLCETTASLGTALTAEQARLLRRFAEKVVLVYDADPAGTEAALRTFEIFNAAGLQIRALSLPDAKDPDEYLHKHGAQALRQLVDSAGGFVEFVLETALARQPVRTVEDKMTVLKKVLPFIQKLPSPVERQEYAKLLADRLSLDAGLVIAEASRAAGPPAPAPVSAPAATAAGRQIQAEELLLGTLLQVPALIPEHKERLSPDWLSDPGLQALWRLLLAAPPFDPDHEEDWLSRVLGIVADPELAQRASALLARLPGSSDPNKVVEDCLRRLEGAHLRDRIAQLQQGIREAERKGDLETCKHLQQKELELKNRLKKLGVDWKPGRRQTE